MSDCIPPSRLTKFSLSVSAWGKCIKSTLSSKHQYYKYCPEFSSRSERCHLETTSSAITSWSGRNYYFRVYNGRYNSTQKVVGYNKIQLNTAADFWSFRRKYTHKNSTVLHCLLAQKFRSAVLLKVAHVSVFSTQFWLCKLYRVSKHNGKLQNMPSAYFSAKHSLNFG